MRSCAKAMRRWYVGIGSSRRRFTEECASAWLSAPHATVARPMDGIDTSLLDSLDLSVQEARVFLIFRLSSILTLIDNSVCFSRTTMIPPDCLEDCLPCIDLAARAWMGNLEVGRNAALLGGTRREKEGLQETGNSNSSPLLHVLKSKMLPTKRAYQQQRRRKRCRTIGNCCWAGAFQQLDGLLGLATNTPNS